MAFDLNPQDHITAGERELGLRRVVVDGVCFQSLISLTGGAILVALALELGAGAAAIGLLMAIGPAAQLLQIPAIVLIDRSARRKLLVVLGSLVGRTCMLSIALLPLLAPAELAVPLLLLLLSGFFAFGAVSGCAFNSWMRDFIPEDMVGRYFGRRMALATLIGAALTLAAGLGMEVGSRYLDDRRWLFAGLYLVGGIVGLVGVLFLARTPEPRMPRHVPQGLLRVLGEPFREQNFRMLLAFAGTWSFAIHLAVPFFAFYMLRRLEMSLLLVLILSVLSQGVNVIFFRIWGGLADRFSNKSVLGISGSMFLFSILLWPFLTLPDAHALTLTMLVIIHVLIGVAAAGINLCTGNIALKLAPAGRSTAYLASHALTIGIAAAAAPLLAGTAMAFLEGQRLTLTLSLSSVEEGMRFSLPAFDLVGLDFCFIAAVIVGIYALHRLSLVVEQGEVERDVVASQFQLELRRSLRMAGNVPLLREVFTFPFIVIEEASQRILGAGRRPKPHNGDDGQDAPP